MEIKVDRSNAPYVMTKPLHPSQEMIGEYADGSILIKLRAHHNFELERLILGFGSSMTVIKPRRLRNRIKKHIEKSMATYEE